MVSDVEYEPLWNMKELARYLKVSRPTALRLVHKFGLPYSQFGGKNACLRFRPEEVRAWVVRNEIAHRD
jgi:excisionase family DNA binding protein